MRVERCFAFVDLSGFTAFTERFGDERTVVVLASFRTRVREIAARRGVRVTKWLGDGAMLSSSDTEAVVAMVVELAARVPAGAQALSRATAKKERFLREPCINRFRVAVHLQDYENCLNCRHEA